MSYSFIRRLIACTGGLTALMLTGCASTKPVDSGFSNVSREAELRTGQTLRWSHDDASVAQLHSAVDARLEEKLTCEAAVQIALLNNQNLQATYEELGISHAQLIEAGLLRNPTVSAEVRFPKYVALPFEVDIAESFLDALMIPLRKQLAEAEYRSAQSRISAEVANLAADVRVAFYRVQSASQIVELRQKIVQGTGASLDAARRMHDAGNVTDLVLLSQHAMEAQSRIDLATANSDLQDARETLSGLLGLWGNQTRWTMDNHLPSLPESEIEPAGLESLAIRQRADLKAQQAQVEVAAAAFDLTRKTAGISDLAIGGKVIQDPDGDITAGPSITVPLPIFNQGQAALSAAQSRLSQAQKRYVALAVQIRSDVRRDRNRLLAARQRAAYYAAVVLPLQRQVVQQTQLESNAMVVGLFQLMMARQEEIDAARQWIDALRDYWVARAELERAVGGRLTSKASTAQPITRPASEDAAREESHAADMNLSSHAHEGTHP